MILVKISSLSDAILPNLPIKAKNLSALLLGFSFQILCLTMCSCSASRIANPVSRIANDTIYISNFQYDSVYVFQDKITDRSRDTIYIKEVKTEYKYRILRDTINQAHRDSIPYEVTIIETKELPRPLTFFDRLCRICFYFLSGALFLLFVKYMFLNKINH